MAEAVLEVVLENLSSLLQKELGLFLGFHQDFKSLASLLTTIKATLEDAEEKQFSDRVIKDWLQKLKDAAHVLDDILDECATEALELEYEGFRCGLPDKVQTSCLSSFHPKHVAFRYKITKKMKRIRERLDEIAEERTKFHLTGMASVRRSGVLDWRQTTSIIAPPQVYGRDEDKDKIVDFLVSDASGFEDLSVYPIVGLGGLGKTTLAQLIFNHERVVNHFELRIWVCVSEDFSLKRMTKAIVESASGHACEDLDLEPLQKKLLGSLQRKRYLLVLDDVWNGEQENWRRLKSVLVCGGKGASILVTTRLQKVAAVMGTMPPHDLSMLSDKDCWELFKQRAFGPNEEERAELVVIGEEIIKKCGGVPLAAIALGGLLRFKREEKEWLYVKESKLWSLQGENCVMPALRLSYLNLPVKLRQCFSFCALFPKDEIIRKQFLIELWMANGFISSNEMLVAEDIGNEVWNELYWRSFFQDIKTDEFGEVTSFKMHDLVHDLAQSVTEEVCCITNDNGVPSTSERIRHLSIYGWKEVDSIRLRGVKSLKTYITTHVGQLPHQVLKGFSLRVLEFQGRKELSSSIGHLKYLRYLNLSWGEFKTLPNSLGELWNLQILKLDNCYRLQKLPNSLIHLKALQHLSLRFCYSLSSLPPQIGKLTSLRTLSRYVVGKKRGLLMGELGQLKLKGELCIKHLERVKSVMDAKEANMSSKHLNELRLSWARNEESQSQENVEQILEVLQPHTQQLQFLGVGGYIGAHFPKWMSSPSLKDLKDLVLLDCKSCLLLPELGKLPSLKTLSISNMSHVIHLDEESNHDGVAGGFIALEVLSLENMPNLLRLSREDRENMFPHLLKLYISECPKLLCLHGGVAGGFKALEFLSLYNMPNLLRLSREDRENMFPHLLTLHISECPKLLGLPCLPSLNGMLMRGKCNQDLLSSIHKLHSLESLQLRNNEELTCFPDGMLSNLTSLKTLEICGHSILTIEMFNLSALQQLCIKNCKSLKSLTDEVLRGLHSLEILEIVRCPKFNLSAGFRYLTCLERLAIGSFSEVEGLQEALQHLTALKSLSLNELPNLTFLPDCLGNLALLQQLLISACPNLTCLPTHIQCLSGLQSLSIYRCPELAKQCQKETGEDWPKIAHVQYLHISDDPVICGAQATYHLANEGSDY